MKKVYRFLIWQVGIYSMPYKTKEKCIQACEIVCESSSSIIEEKCSEYYFNNFAY